MHFVHKFYICEFQSTYVHYGYFFIFQDSCVVYREFMWPEVEFSVKCAILLVPAISISKSNSHSGL